MSVTILDSYLNLLRRNALVQLALDSLKQLLELLNHLCAYIHVCDKQRCVGSLVDTW